MVRSILITIIAALLCAGCTNNHSTLPFEQIDEEIEASPEAGLEHVKFLMKSIDKHLQHDLYVHQTPYHPHTLMPLVIHYGQIGKDCLFSTGRR